MPQKQQRQDLDDSIVRTFFRFQHELKLFHWRTYSYAKHKASDKLTSKIIDLIDEFIEVYMGRFHRRVSFDSNRGLTIQTYTDQTIVSLLEKFGKFLCGLDSLLPTRSTDLLNIRDEMLAAVNQTIYLFSLH